MITPITALIYALPCQLHFYQLDISLANSPVALFNHVLSFVEIFSDPRVDIYKYSVYKAIII